MGHYTCDDKEEDFSMEKENKHFRSQQKRVQKLAGKLMALAVAYNAIPGGLDVSEGMNESLNAFLDKEFEKYRRMLYEKGHEDWSLAGVSCEEKALELAYQCLNKKN